MISSFAIHANTPHHRALHWPAISNNHNPRRYLLMLGLTIRRERWLHDRQSWMDWWWCVWSWFWRKHKTAKKRISGHSSLPWSYPCSTSISGNCSLRLAFVTVRSPTIVIFVIAHGQLFLWPLCVSVFPPPESYCDLFSLCDISLSELSLWWSFCVILHYQSISNFCDLSVISLYDLSLITSLFLSTLALLSLCNLMRQSI